MTGTTSRPGRLRRLGLYLTVSLLALGVMSQPDLAAHKSPSMAGVLERVAGPWGASLMNLGRATAIRDIKIAALIDADASTASGYI